MDILLQTGVLGPIGSLVVTFLLGFTTILLLFWYSFRKQTYWKKLGVPYDPPYPFVGSILESIIRPFHETEQDRYNKHGRIYGHFEGNTPLLSVGDPELLREIFVKNFQTFSGARTIQIGDTITSGMMSFLRGEDWKRVRTIVSPTFTTGKIRRMLSIFNDCSKTLVKNFRAEAEKGEPVEAKSLYGAFTMDVIASSAFSTKIDTHNDPQNEFVKAARAMFAFNYFNWKIFVFLLMPGIIKYLRISIFNSKSMKFFRDATLQIIEERKRTGQTRNDFLQLLMDTAKEVPQEDKLDTSEKDGDITENYGSQENDLIFKNISSKKGLSFDELVAQCITFFMAGYESTATTLAFSNYLLALNPDIQEKLIQDVDTALRENNGELTYEAIQSMKYLDNVISETLRVFPPIIRLERAAEENYKLGDTGIIIPKGMLVTIPVYAMHRDPKFFPNPEKFDPDRWLPEERSKRSQYTYLPFGAGPRNCVAMRFALMEIKVCLAHVISNFRIKKCSKTKVPLDFHKIGFWQHKGIDVLFEIRKDAVKAF